MDGGSFVKAMYIDQKVGRFKPQHCQAATARPLSKALNHLCSSSAVSWLTLYSNKLGYAKKRISLYYNVHVTNKTVILLVSKQ